MARLRVRQEVTDMVWERQTLRFQFRAVAVGLGRRDGFMRYLRV